MPQLKTKIEERIRELVPELQELKFGCEVRLGLLGYILNRKNYHKNWLCYPINEENDHQCLISQEEIDLDKTFTIIGSPIHLEHILMAIEKAKPQYKNNEFPDWITYFGYLILNLVAIYDLSKSFADQKEETYQFLWSIITPH